MSLPDVVLAKLGSRWHTYAKAPVCRQCPVLKKRCRSYGACFFVLIHFTTKISSVSWRTPWIMNKDQRF